MSAGLQVFQRNIFQNNVFQVGHVATGPTGTGGWGAGGLVGYKPKKHPENTFVRKLSDLDIPPIAPVETNYPTQTDPRIARREEEEAFLLLLS